MSKGRIRTSFAAAVAAYLFWPANVPNPDPAEQRNGDPAAATRAYNDLVARGRQLNDERARIDFNAETIENAQKRIDPARGDLPAQVEALENLNVSHKARFATFRRERNAFHGQLLLAPQISEADISSFYREGGALEGTKDDLYYHHEIAYRDECRTDGHRTLPALQSCMTERQNTEAHERGTRKVSAMGIAFVLSLGGLYGAPALQTLQRRRRQNQHTRGEKKKQAAGEQAVAEIKTMLAPRTGTRRRDA